MEKKFWELEKCWWLHRSHSLFSRAVAAWPSPFGGLAARLVTELLRRGTRFCRELCEPSTAPPADTETPEAPFPQIFFFPQSSPSFTDVLRILLSLAFRLLALTKLKLPAGSFWTAGWRYHSSSISPLQVTNLLLLLCRNVSVTGSHLRLSAFKAPLLGWPPPCFWDREGEGCTRAALAPSTWAGSSPSQAAPSTARTLGKSQCRPEGILSLRKGKSFCIHVGKAHWDPALSPSELFPKSFLPPPTHPAGVFHSAPTASSVCSSPLLYNSDINNKQKGLN